MVKWIIIAILLLPLAEIAAFIAVAGWIGFAPALLLVVLSTLAGTWLLRQSGRGGVAHFRVAARNADGAGFEANAGGLVTVMSGLLLFVPGFLTSLLGAALLIGPVRRGCAKAVVSWWRRRSVDNSVVDLSPGEWQTMPERELPRRSPDRD